MSAFDLREISDLAARVADARQQVQAVAAQDLVVAVDLDGLEEGVDGRAQRGDGGHGGSVYLIGDDALNTLIDFKYQRFYKAQNGQPGQGRQMSGKAGDELHVKVPVGTTVIDEDTLEVIADVTEIGQVVLVAQGGRRGLGNIHFKSSTNRS